jgi:hypothetical protein
MPNPSPRSTNVVLVVVGFFGLAIALVALATGPSAARLGTFSAILVATATLELALVTYFQGQQLRYFSEESRRAPLRPLLMPDGQLASGELWPAQHTELHVRNVHGGPATNVLVVVLPQTANRTSYFFPFYGRLAQPIVAGERVKLGLGRGSVLIGEDDCIGSVPLFAPPEPSSGPTQPVARVTITCTDVMGLKHASVADWTTQGVWVAIATLSEVSEDIHDIDARNQSRVKP